MSYFGEVAIRNRAATDVVGTTDGSLNVTATNLPMDAFGRVRESSPFSLFASKQLNNKQPVFWDEELFGTATSTHVPANACTEMVTVANGDGVVRQTLERFNYQPGKSQLVLMTFNANAASPSAVSFNIAKGGTTTETAAQASWHDPMDGTGASGITMDWTATQIMFIDFEWLGVGSVRCGFIIDGKFVLVHTFHHANDPAFPSVYMSTPNLPVGYQIYQTGGAARKRLGYFSTSNAADSVPQDGIYLQVSGGDLQLDHICSSVMSEGGLEELAVNQCIDNGITAVTATVAGTKYALLGLRLQAGSDATVILRSVNALITSVNDIGYVQLLRNPTVAGVFTYANKANSETQVATGVTANTVTGGDVLWTHYISSDLDATVDSRVLPRPGIAIDGTADEYVLVGVSYAGASDFVAALSWNELG